MVFSSLTFLLFFLPAVLLIYFAVPRQAKNTVLFLFSLLFYAWGEPIYVALMLFSTALDYTCGRLVEKYRGTKKQKIGLLVSIIVNIGLLCFFKYTDFFIGAINGIFGCEIPALNLPLPIGISFYTFQTMSYTIDVYRGEARVQKNIVSFGAYVALFPQLIAGPIVRYRDIAEQLDSRIHSADNFGEGAKRFVTGLGKKVLLANNIGLLWDAASKTDAAQLTAVGAWLGIIAFAFQIYFDFSGYSDMAIGLGKIFGFDFCENFNYPYISKSVTEFWRRWHITLGRWFREYVYIPLGGNRQGKARTFFNLFVVWSLTALWHGANYNFLIWGGILLCCLLVEKLFLLRLLDKSRVIGHLYVLFVVPLSWVAFAVTDLSELGVYMTRLFPFAGHAAGVINHLDYLKYLNDYAPLFLLGVLFATPLPETCYRLIERRWIGRVILLGIFGLCMYYLAVSANNPFLYFNF